ncbi:hypothetical protein ACFL20_10120, partial [Spirochaetota bacterium]
FQKSGCTDQECAVKIGRLLSVKKIFMGSINKLGSYEINIKMVNIETGRIEESFRGNAKDESKLINAINDIADKIKDTIPDSNNGGDSTPIKLDLDYRIEAAFDVMAPVGDFSNLTKSGIGGYLSFSVDIFKKVNVGIGAGYYSFMQ